ncbi:MAG: hypothetical protein OXN89_23660 [Bryobacterales bacterium]|nr:hypothetical protein [Bryobacterales bacterium]
MNESGFLDEGYDHGDPAALRVADRMAVCEHLNPTLRNIAEEVGGLDHSNTRLVRAGMARMATENLQQIMHYSCGMGSEADLGTARHRAVHRRSRGGSPFC